MKTHINAILKILIGWPLSLLALFFITKTFLPEFSKIQSYIYNLNIWLLGIGILCFTTYYFFRSYIWHKLIEYQGHHFDFRDTSFLWSFAQLRRYIPGNIWALVSLAVLFDEKKVTKKQIALGVFIESQVVIIATIFLAILSFPFLFDSYIKNISFQEQIPFITLILCSIGLLVYVYNRHVLSLLPEKLQKYLHHIFPSFPPHQIITLFLLMITSYVFYGLGYYFSVSSVILLDPSKLPLFIGIFTLSLLVGFLSFLTPTGLGVREGVIALALTNYMSFALAGFVSLFSRVIIIISELLYVTLSYIWHKYVNEKIKRIEMFISNNRHECLLWILIIVYNVYFTIVSFLRYDNFYTGRFDLGNMAQTVWNTAHGRIFEFSNPDGVEIVSRLAFHADFILILLAPFYWVWENPKMLLLIQVIIVSLGAYFVYRLSTVVLTNRTVSLALAFLYLMNPSIQRANIYDFHAVTLATTFFLAAFYYLKTKKYRLMLLFLFLAGITKEQVWAIVGLFGLYLVFFEKKIKSGVTLFILSFLMVYYLLWHAIPNASSHTGHFALSYFKDGGDSPSDLIKNILFHPIQTINKILEPERMYYLQQLFLPLGFLSLLSPLFLLFASPDFIINLLSDKPHLHQIYYQYTAVISAFLFIAAIYGIKTLEKIFPKISFTLYTGYIILFAFFGAYLYGPLPGSKEPNLAMFTRPQKDRMFITSYINKIPGDISIAANNNIGSHLSHRRLLFTLPRGVKEAEMIIFLLNDPNASPSIDAHKQLLFDLSTNGQYIILVEKENFVVLKKRNTNQ